MRRVADRALVAGLVVLGVLGLLVFAVLIAAVATFGLLVVVP